MGFVGGLVAVLLGMAVVVLIVFSFGMFIRISQIDRQIQEDAGTVTALKVAIEKKNEQFDSALIVEVQERMKEIDEVIENLNAIAEDIGRLDQMVAQDHRDLVDIRTRYINYREPVKEDLNNGNDA